MTFDIFQSDQIWQPCARDSHLMGSGEVNVHTALPPHEEMLGFELMISTSQDNNLTIVLRLARKK